MHKNRQTLYYSLSTNMILVDFLCKNIFSSSTLYRMHCAAHTIFFNDSEPLVFAEIALLRCFAMFLFFYLAVQHPFLKTLIRV